MTRRRRLELAVIGAFVISLPTILIIWSNQGSLAAALLAVSLLAMLAGGLLVARRI